jgi:hypothetical protein
VVHVPYSFPAEFSYYNSKRQIGLFTKARN